ncbi:RNA-directed DNA polymerase [Hydrogenophaga sp.]|uniref:RNA-directed DNA polymerase n=1 Tax=Hydrogenophaga sp. TaxID=1904254 RepID=UPI0027353AE5|nr:RNA-directed DNA polymerase [Hydrogenophaga sp.]MDP3886204.1 RNA-directed DNA polymerase [Hydrogenophaga sp.]
MNRSEALLSRGFFPSQVPPAFSTRLLASQLSTLQADWSINKPKAKAPSCKPEIFSVARAGHQRRITSLTNPVPQVFLATFIGRHWADFLKHYRKSRLSGSHPRFLPSGDRAACIPSMQRLHERKILESAGFKYMLRTDVSRFFPTVYTHSVPWALHTKTAAKKNRNITPKYFGNLIDQALRQGQDEQTMGLPIGPDTSHIIAESIATSVDLLLKNSLKLWPAGFRYVDDYFLFFPTIAEAENALAVLSRALKEFELQINFEKTKICPVSELVDDYWSHQLRSFEIAKDGKRQRSDIHHFFELAKDLAAKNADENVMTYALKRASSILIRHENWDAFEAHVCHVALSHPNTLQTVSQIFATYKFHAYTLNKGRTGRTINALVAEHAALGHHSEVAWCLWMCKELDIKLESANVDLVATMQSSICALLLMDLAVAGKLSKSPKETFWRSIDGEDSLREEMWLVCYEAGIRGWGGFTNIRVANDEYFKRLHALNINFYDSEATSTLLFNVKPGALDKFKLAGFNEFFELDDVEDYLEYQGGGGGYEGVIFDDDDDDDDDDELSTSDDVDEDSDEPF